VDELLAHVIIPELSNMACAHLMLADLHAMTAKSQKRHRFSDAFLISQD